MVVEDVTDSPVYFNLIDIDTAPAGVHRIPQRKLICRSETFFIQKHIGNPRNWTIDPGLLASRSTVAHPEPSSNLTAPEHDPTNKPASNSVAKIVPAVVAPVVAGIIALAGWWWLRKRRRANAGTLEPGYAKPELEASSAKASATRGVEMDGDEQFEMEHATYHEIEGSDARFTRSEMYAPIPAYEMDAQPSTSNSRLQETQNEDDI